VPIVLPNTYAPEPSVDPVVQQRTDEAMLGVFMHKKRGVEQLPLLVA
jgi:hypothetical protein